MRIAVCDDEQLQVKINVTSIRKWAKNREIDVNIDTFASAEAFLFHWSEGLPYDLAVFDIQMKNMTGVELAKMIRKTDHNLSIVFITGLMEHVLEGYDVSAINYLVKPYPEPELFKTLDKALAVFMEIEQGALLVPQEGKLIRLPYAEILYMEIQGHYFDISTKTKGRFRMKKQMAEMLEIIDADLFIQCHRSFIVNVSLIDQIRGNEIILRTNDYVPLSQANARRVTELFIRHHNEVQGKKGRNHDD